MGARGFQDESQDSVTPYRSGLAFYRIDGRVHCVRVVYSDESGTGDEATQPVTVVAGLLVNMKRQWPHAEKLMRRIADQFPELVASGEFKGSHLFREIRRGEPGPAATALMSVLSVTQDVRLPIFYGAVDRAGLRRYQKRPDLLPEYREHTAIDWAFHDCMKAVDRYIATLVPPEDVLWIHDHAGHHESAIRAALTTFNDTRKAENRLRRPEPPYLPPEAEFIGGGGLILDTVYFGHSETSHMLQLADVCASVIRAYIEGRVDSAFFEIIRPSLIGAGGLPRFTEPLVIEKLPDR